MKENHSGNTNLLKGDLVVSLYLPWILSLVIQADPVTSYLVAWLGSFFIFYQTWFSPNRFVLPDLPIHKQIMRPIFLQQFIFAGFMCCTSIFYFLDTIDYNYFDPTISASSITQQKTLSFIAQCQRLSLLGHIALVTGILILQRRHFFDRPAFKPVSHISAETWTIRLCITTFIISIALGYTPGLAQFGIGLYNVAVFSGAVLFVKGIIDRNVRFLIWGGSVFVANVLNSTLTGFKEHIIINFIIIACLLFPHYKKAVLIFSIPFFTALLYISPLYSNIIRKQAWEGTITAEEARSEAIDAIFFEEEDEEIPLIEETDKEFFTHRLSEISMFATFVESTPDKIPYYYFDILKNSLISIVPRALWADKPVTETIAMERVYLAGVISRNSNVSAKTRPVVDGYLSAGILGVFIYLFFLGCLSQFLSNKAENMFGGYHIGTVIFFNGFFQQLWRGETIEFMLNTIFWSFVAMYILFRILRLMNYLEKIKST